MRHVRQIGRLLWGLLRELSDESAYERHLAAHGRTHSGEEWRRFCEEKAYSRFTRPKCC